MLVITKYSINVILLLNNKGGFMIVKQNEIVETESFNEIIKNFKQICNILVFYEFNPIFNGKDLRKLWGLLTI